MPCSQFRDSIQLMTTREVCCCVIETFSWCRKFESMPGEIAEASNNAQATNACGSISKRLAHIFSEREKLKLDSSRTSFSIEFDF